MNAVKDKHFSEASLACPPLYGSIPYPCPWSVCDIFHASPGLPWEHCLFVSIPSPSLYSSVHPTMRSKLSLGPYLCPSYSTSQLEGLVEIGNRLPAMGGISWRATFLYSSTIHPSSPMLVRLLLDPSPTSNSAVYVFVIWAPFFGVEIRISVVRSIPDTVLESVRRDLERRLWEVILTLLILELHGTEPDVVA